jgi:hypothetical protein
LAHDEELPQSQRDFTIAVMDYRVSRRWEGWVLRPDRDPFCGLDYHPDKVLLTQSAKTYVEVHGGTLIIEDEDGQEEERFVFAPAAS